jgi:hypothetical protein
MRHRLRLSILCAALASCGREDAASEAQPPAASNAPPLDPVPTAAPATSIEDPTPMPGPRRARLGAAVSLNADCMTCHDEEARTWRASRHHQASTNAAYRAAHAVEPAIFCQDCHAPESMPGKAPPRAVDELGIGCVTCHVTEEGVVLAAPTARGDEQPPHPVHRSAAFAQTGACAGCHEFRFPGALGDDDGRFMQTTVREHHRSSTADKPCAECHMPRTEGRRSHAFTQVRDPDWLRARLDARAERAGEGRIRVELVQPEPGHGFPTGDLFRRLEIGCEARDAEGKMLARTARYLARHLVLQPGSSDRRLIGDDRVFDAPRVVELAISPAPPPGARITWWVKLQRVATVGTGEDPAGAKIESEVQIHSGVLP